MNTKDIKKTALLFYQAADALRSSPLPLSDQKVLAIQLIAWADLSGRQSIDIQDDMATAVAAGADVFLSALERFSQHDGLIGQAFSNAALLARSALPMSLDAAQRVQQLFETRKSSDQIFPSVLFGQVSARDHDLAVADQVVEMLVRLSAADHAASIYCPWDTGGQLAAATFGCDGDVHVESRTSEPFPALACLFRKGASSVAVTDPLEHPSALEDGRLKKFESTIAFPPLGMKASPDSHLHGVHRRFAVPKASSTGLMIQHIVARTTGKAAIIVPHSFLFGSGADSDVRKFLLEKRFVEAVIALPSGMVRGSNIPVALLLLDMSDCPCESIAFVDAAGPALQNPSRRGELLADAYDDLLTYVMWSQEMRRDDMAHLKGFVDEAAVEVSAEQVLGEEASLQVDRYVLPRERRRLNGILKRTPRISLSTVATVVAPIANADRVNEGEGLCVKEVGAADLPGAGYIRAPSREVWIRPSRPDAIFLRPHDIVLVIKGSAGKVGLVPPEVPGPGPGGWIAAQSAVVLRAMERGFSGPAHALLLRSSLGQELLASIRSGSSVQMISLKSLKALEIPALTVEMTNKANGILREEIRLQQEIEQLQTRLSALSESLWDEMLEESGR